MGIIDTLRRFLSRGGKRSADYSSTYGHGAPGGFAGGAVNRLTASMATWSGAVNADLDVALPVLRARGRQLAQNNEYGRRFLSLAAANVVGANAPKLQVRATMAPPPGEPRADQARVKLDKVANDAVEAHWARWCKSAEITGRMDFAHMCRVVIKAVARDGEALVRIVRQPGLPYGLALQVLEADRLDDTMNLVLPRGAIRQGVEIDSTGRPVAYWIRTAHPGDRYATDRGQVERVPASELRHVFLPERAEQVRGYTWFHAILLRAMQLHGFNDAAVVAARIGASKVAAIERVDTEMPAPSNALEGQASGQVGGALQFSVEAGEMFELPAGYKLNSWNPEYPHSNFESFVKAAMRGLSVGVDVAAHNLSGDMTDVNYSSARIAELSERELWMTMQAWFIRVLVEPVYEEWLAVALLRGDIVFPQSGKALPAEKLTKFREASRFQGRRWPWVDPAKEIEAAERGVNLGVTSRTRLAAERGEDFEDVLDELQQESEMLRKANLMPVTQQQVQQPQQQQQRPPADE
jgi:lambda family phage portal protein